MNTISKADTEILRQVPFFSHMADDQLAHVYQTGKLQSLPTGGIVMREGDVADCMYVLLSGEVAVNKIDDSGHSISIATLSAGDFFGEMALLDQGTRSATVVCQTPCNLFILERTAFIDLLAKADSNVVYRLFAALTRRVRDTTERVLREELAKQRLEADMEIERHRSLSQMVAGVAHEINTPLGIINTAANLIANRLKAGTLQPLVGADRRAVSTLEDIQEASELIQGNIARTHKLVQDFKKISVNQINDVRETTSLSEVIHSSIDLFRINARKAKLTISINDNLPANHKVWIGYPGALTQVMMNLLTNVERYAYTPEIGGSINIDLSAQNNSDDSLFIVEVRDYGKGIPAENLPHIFEPFFTTGRSRGGTGLGMSIVYNIVTSMLSGQIDIESEPEKGTIVRLTLPPIAPERS